MIESALDEALEARRMTMAQLSDSAGIPLRSIERIVDGDFRALRRTSLDGICRALDCQPGEFLRYVAD